MPSFTYKQTEHHQLTRTYEYEFDTSDKGDWDILLEAAKSNGVDVSELSKKPPKDPYEWLTLIRKISIDDIAEYEDDCWTMNNGDFEVTNELLDDKGKRV